LAELNLKNKNSW